MKISKKQLEMGKKHEMEHTDDPKKALKTARDHLKKHAHYYTYLKAMDRKMKRDEQKA